MRKEPQTTVQDTVLETVVVQMAQHAKVELLPTLRSDLYLPILVIRKSDTGKLITWSMKISPFQ